MPTNPDPWAAIKEAYPWLQDYIERGGNKVRWATGQSDPIASGAGSVGLGNMGPLWAMGPAAGYMGYANLMNILASNGRTDPALMNQELAGMGRDTAAKQAGLSQELARRGLGNSGVGMALGQAIGTSGAAQMANRRAQESQIAEQRRRQDLDLLRQLVIQPGIDYSALYSGQYNQAQQRGQTRDASNAAQQQQYMNMLLSLVGLFA